MTDTRRIICEKNKKTPFRTPFLYTRNFLLFYWNYVNNFNVASDIVKTFFSFVGKFNHAFDNRIKGVVGTTSDIFAGQKFSAALADNN